MKKNHHLHNLNSILKTFLTILAICLAFCYRHCERRHFYRSGEENEPIFYEFQYMMPKFGLELSGISTQAVLDFDTSLLERLIWENKLVLIRGLERPLSVSELVSISKKLGDLAIHIESSSRLSDYPEVTRISNIVDFSSNKSIGLSGQHVENYHSDISWSQNPAAYSILQSIIKPSSGGETIFVDTQAAFDDLPDTVKNISLGKSGKFCYLNLMKDFDRLSEEEISLAEKCAIHPLIKFHPITNFPGIYANPSDTTEILGNSDINLLQFLFDHVDKSPHKYIHKWESNDLLLWDNRSLQHRATGCPSLLPRLLYRTLVLEKNL